MVGLSSIEKRSDESRERRGSQHTKRPVYAAGISFELRYWRHAIGPY